VRTLKPWRRHAADKERATGGAQPTGGVADRARPTADDDGNPFGREHAWWAERDRLQRVFVAPSNEDGETQESSLSDFWSPESLFTWGRKPGDEDDAWDEEEIPLDPYEVLGLPMYATWDQVTAAHRRLAKEHHPDRLLDAPDDVRAASEERMRQVNQAYNELRRQRRASETAGTQASSTYYSSS
jgi:hypothetical protein